MPVRAPARRAWPGASAGRSGCPPTSSAAARITAGVGRGRGTARLLRSSRPWRALWASPGARVPPGGVPASVGTCAPGSMTPAGHHALTWRLRVGLGGSGRRQVGWSMRAKPGAGSASSTPWACGVLRTERAPIASHAEHPGRKPALWGAKPASPWASHARVTPAGRARSGLVGRPTGLLSAGSGGGLLPRRPARRWADRACSTRLGRGRTMVPGPRSGARYLRFWRVHTTHALVFQQREFPPDRAWLAPVCLACGLRRVP